LSERWLGRADIQWKRMNRRRRALTDGRRKPELLYAIYGRSAVAGRQIV
jgi:hypothetical protein